MNEASPMSTPMIFSLQLLFIGSKRILRNLQGTKDPSLIGHKCTDSRLYGFSDSDGKKTTIFKSSIEAEFRSLVTCEAEIIWSLLTPNTLTQQNEERKEKGDNKRAEGRKGEEKEREEGRDVPPSLSPRWSSRSSCRHASPSSSRRGRERATTTATLYCR
ncbi:uncharacterized protein LOC130951262 isoform X1 [Arachis stenosperma]|uniref:uncharacterized protein LOC130951262 isoform X1 n=1 Tax=Arachis stenosperma TaxID=217475 RepID=UPI0025AD666D|nr:uncharacterized protein LOC130951262 isoform X1 [Arachis stenosperma]